MKGLPNVQIDPDSNNESDFQCVVPIAELIADLESILVSLDIHEKHLACAMLQRCIDELTDE